MFNIKSRQFGYSFDLWEPLLLPLVYRCTNICHNHLSIIFTNNGNAHLPGLRYKVLEKGSGAFHPKVNSPCLCHYGGTLIDGTEFDSSYSRG